jgi:hypothetical protein
MVPARARRFSARHGANVVLEHALGSIPQGDKATADASCAEMPTKPTTARRSAGERLLSLVAGADHTPTSADHSATDQTENFLIQS